MILPRTPLGKHCNENARIRTSGASRRKLDRFAAILQHLIQRASQQMRALLVISRSIVIFVVFLFLFPLQQVILIRNVQRRQHRQPHRIDRVRSLRHRPHLRIHIFGELQNIFRIRSPQVISLIENLHAHAFILRIPKRRILSRSSHNCAPLMFCHSERSEESAFLTFCHSEQSEESAFSFRTLVSSQPSWPVPPQSNQSAPASSPPAREFPRALSSTAPSRAAAPQSAPHALPTADAVSAQPAPPTPAPAAPPCTSQ